MMRLNKKINALNEQQEADMAAEHAAMDAAAAAAESQQ